MEFTPEQKKTAIIAAAAAAGTAQTIIINKVMPNFPSTMAAQLTMLGGFGKPAPIAGVAGGALAIILGIFVLKDNQYSNALVAYGGSALASGLLAGLL